MKNAFIRMMSVAVFATSISAFAMSNDAKAAENKNSNNTAVGTAVETNASPALDRLLEKVDQLQGEVQQLAVRDKENQDGTNKKIRQQEKDWEHSLLGNYGG